MRSLVPRKTLEAEGPAEAAAPRPKPVETGSEDQWPMVAWIHDGPVQVTIIDEPQRTHDASCRCGGCHASATAELAARFLPD